MQRPRVIWTFDVTSTVSNGRSAVEFRTENGWLPTSDLREVVAFVTGTNEFATSQGGDGTYKLVIDASCESAVLSLLSGLAIIEDGKGTGNLGFALGWHTVPGQGATRTALGELEKAAKWDNDQHAAHELCKRMVDFAESSHGLRQCDLVVGIPSSHSLASQLSTAVAGAIGQPHVSCAKTKGAPRQSDAADTGGFAELRSRMEGTIVVPQVPPNRHTALIVDDLYSSGGTIMEVRRCLQSLGISSVYSLTVVKTARHHRQT